MAATVRIALIADGSKAKQGFGEAENAAKSFSTRLEVMTNGFDNFGGRVGDTSSALSGMAPAFEAMGMTGAAAKMEGVIIALDAIEGATMLMSVAQSAYNAVMATGKLQLVASTVATVAHAAAMGVVRVATVTWTAVQWALNAALLANPIGLIVVAIGLLVAGIVLAWKHSETFRTVVTGAFEAVKNVAGVVWGFIKNAAVVAFGFIKTYIQTQINIVKAVLNALKAAASAVWNGIKAVATAVWGFIKTYITTQINAVKAVFNFLKTNFVAGFNIIKSTAANVWNSIKSAVTNALNTAKQKFNDLKTAASTVLSKIKSLFSPSALLNAGRQLIEGLARGVSEKINKVIDVVKAGVARIKGLLPGSPIKWGPLKSWNNGGAGKRLMGMLGSGIRAGAPALNRTVSSVLAGIANPSINPDLSLGSVSSLGALAGAGGNTYQITVQVAPGADLVEAGRQMTNAISAYERAGGRKRA